MQRTANNNAAKGIRRIFKRPNQPKNEQAYNKLQPARTRPVALSHPDRTRFRPTLHGGGSMFHMNMVYNEQPVNPH